MTNVCHITRPRCNNAGNQPPKGRRIRTDHGGHGPDSDAGGRLGYGHNSRTLSASHWKAIDQNLELHVQDINIIILSYTMRCFDHKNRYLNHDVSRCFLQEMLKTTVI